MSKSDFEALAAIIKAQREKGTAHDVVDSVLDDLARDMTQYLARKNPRFDAARFLTAAGVS